MRKRDAVSLARCVLLVATAIASEASKRVGVEFQVNSYTPNDQTPASVAVDADGDFVIVWNSYRQDGASGGAFAQRFDSTGARQGGELQISSLTSNREQASSVAMNAVGDFIVTWSAPDGAGFGGVFARRFSSVGAAVGSEFQVNVYTPRNQEGADVALADSGDFVVAWTSFYQDGGFAGVFGRRFGASGEAIGAELQISAYTRGNQEAVRVAVNPRGDFLIVWQSNGQDGDSYGVFARRYDSTGALHPELMINTRTQAAQLRPEVAAGGDGAFVVVWESGNPYYGPLELLARRIDPDASPLGTELLLETADAEHATAVMDRAGGFVIVFDRASTSASDRDTFARPFDASGAARGEALRVNSYTPNGQFVAHSAIDGNGRIVIAWLSEGEDGDRAGLFAQRLDVAAVLDVDGDGAVKALTDGVLVLRYLFGFTGTTLTGGAIGSGCTRCDAAAIEDYLAGLV
jgi:hypothetical protein